MPTIDANNFSDELSLEDDVVNENRRVRSVFPPANDVGMIRAADAFNTFRKDKNEDALLLDLYQRLANSCLDGQLLNNAGWIGSQIVAILSREVQRVKLDKPTKLRSAAACPANQRIKDLLSDVGRSSTHHQLLCSMRSAFYTLWMCICQAALWRQPGI